MTKISIVYSTFKTQEDAVKALKVLISENLATCGNILAPHLAIYKWKGEVHEEVEVIVIFKTLPERLDALKNRLHAIHPYDVPCILSWDSDALPDYVSTFV